MHPSSDPIAVRGAGFYGLYCPPDEHSIRAPHLGRLRRIAQALLPGVPVGDPIVAARIRPEPGAIHAITEFFYVRPMRGSVLLLPPGRMFSALHQHLVLMHNGGLIDVRIARPTLVLEYLDGCERAPFGGVPIGLAGWPQHPLRDMLERALRDYEALVHHTEYPQAVALSTELYNEWQGHRLTYGQDPIGARWVRAGMAPLRALPGRHNPLCIPRDTKPAQARIMYLQRVERLRYMLTFTELADRTV